MKIAIIRIRGDVRIANTSRRALELLGLKQKNHCMITEDAPHVRGMLRTIEPLITWGAVDDKTLAALQKKGGKVFRLNPPRKGYGRKGIKMPYKMSGAYGDRKEKINDLLSRMM